MKNKIISLLEYLLVKLDEHRFEKLRVTSDEIVVKFGQYLLPDSEWHHLAATFETSLKREKDWTNQKNTTVTLYIDGQRKQLEGDPNVEPSKEWYHNLCAWYNDKISYTLDPKRREQYREEYQRFKAKYDYLAD